MLAPTIHAPGIYFSLDETVYHADPALGSTSIKALARSPVEYQYNRLYGEEKDTEYLTFGQALHKRILEGRAVFESRFCKEFDKAVIPDGALDTIDHLREFLRRYDQRGFSSRKKEDLIRMVQEIDPNQPITDVLKQEWQAKQGTKIPLKPKRWEQVEVAARWAQQDPLLSAVMEDGTFIEGAPEVSIFYEDRGIRMKARFDRLLRHAIVDLKSFAPIFEESIQSAALKTIDRMRYDVQAADYLRAWQAGKSLFKEGCVFGDEPVPGFLDDAFDRDEPKWIWIMIKSTGAPQPLVVDWNARNARGAAAMQVEHAINQYVKFRDEFGDDKEWPPRNPAWTVEDSDLPVYFGAR
jgi:hypothetical protein